MGDLEGSEALLAEPQSLVRYLCPIEGCGVHPRNYYNHLVDFHNVYEIDALCYYTNLEARELYKFVQCPEQTCLKMMLDGVFIRHLILNHKYRRSEAAIMLLARAAAPMPQPVIDLDSDNDEIVTIDADPEPDAEDRPKGEQMEIDEGEKAVEATVACADPAVAVDMPVLTTEEAPAALEGGFGAGDVSVMDFEAPDLAKEEPPVAVVDSCNNIAEPTTSLKESPGITILEMMNQIVAEGSGVEANASSAVTEDKKIPKPKMRGNRSSPYFAPLASKSGVRFEKRLTAKDFKRLKTGEITLDEFKEQKLESDRRREEMDKREAQPGYYNIRETRDSVSGDDAEPASSSTVHKNVKKEERSAAEISRCRMCLSYRLRVVDYDREDGKNILECANRKCLASICLTDKPAGTMIETPKNCAANCGWMMDSASRRAYPDMEKIKSGELTANPDIIPFAADEEGGDLKFLRCPGQRARVRII